MIKIHYRPLAFAREYQSVCLPVPARPDPLGDDVARGAARFAALGMFEDGTGYWRDESTGEWLSTHPHYPNACGTIAARDANSHTRIPRDLLYGNRPAGLNYKLSPRTRAPTTQQIPIAVDATLPAIAAALERLKASLGRNGTAAQLLAVEAIAKAVEGVDQALWNAGDEEDLRRVVYGQILKRITDP